MGLKRLFRKHKSHVDSRLKKYKGYTPASNGREMQHFIDWIKTWSTLEVKNIFEIGANFAQDADTWRYSLMLPQKMFMFLKHTPIFTML